MSGPRSLTVLIAALGGEGGGVLSEWLVDAATRAGHAAQSTSIPGVAQRTGATTYYVEIWPEPRAGAGPEPVMSLTPSPGNVDLMVASELVEAGRALQAGFVTPERTTLIASTHRVYATAEKMPARDGRYDGTRVLAAARQLARRAVLLDFERLAREHGTVINAVLFGALAGSGVLPLAHEHCEAAIRAAGRGAEASLRGFTAGHQLAAAATPAPEPAAAGVVPVAPAPVDPRVAAEFPPPLHALLSLGTARLDQYQGPRYTALYLARLRRVLASDRGPGFALTAEAGRQLALWMAYEDVVRVAWLKTRPERFAHIRREVRAAAHEPVEVIDYLKPGLEELAALLPRGPGARLLARAERRGWLARGNVGLHLKTSGLPGFLLMRALAALRPLRPFGWRYADEQRQIDDWLAALVAAAASDPARALAIARAAEVVRGYGETRRRGLAEFRARLAAAGGAVPATGQPAGTTPAAQPAAS